MHEVWLCQYCGATNRGALDTCYKCEAPRTEPAKSGARWQPGAISAPPAQPSYIPAWPIGYLAVVLLILQVVCQLGLLAAGALLALPTINPDKFAETHASAAILVVCVLGYPISLVAAVVVHGAFLALTDSNVPALGGGKPDFGPLRAFFWWIESALWALRVNLTVLIPMGIGILAAALFDTRFAPVVALVLLAVAIMIFGFPLVVLRKPGRLLEDLTRRLMPSELQDDLAGKWSASWGTARMCEVLVPAISIAWFLIVVAVMAPPRGSGQTISAAQTSSIGSAVVILGVIVAVLTFVQVVANARSMWLLARLTLSLCTAQRVLRKWTRENGGASAGATAYAQPVYGAAQPTYGAAQPAPAIPRPRWMRTSADISGVDQSAAMPPAAAYAPAEEYAPAAAYAPAEEYAPVAPPFMASPVVAPPPAPPLAPPPIDPTRVVLLPSSTSVSRYGHQNLGRGPDGPLPRE